MYNTVKAAGKNIPQISPESGGNPFNMANESGYNINNTL
jgi:hypothetical protein